MSDRLGKVLWGVVVCFDGTGRIYNATAFLEVVAVVPRRDVLHNSMANAMAIAGLRCVCMLVSSSVYT